MEAIKVLNDLNAAERAFERVLPEMEALAPEDFSPMNVDVVAAASTILGVSERILDQREALAALGGFDIKHVDNLVDYATAAWFAYVSNLSSQEPADYQELMEELVQLRAKFLLWAEPLAASGNFEASAIRQIKDGSGNKDVPSDVVALVGLFRSKWDEIADSCAVTEADLERGAQIGPHVFALVSQREQRVSRAATHDSVRVRRAWTLADRAYDQCRRGLHFLFWGQGEQAMRVAPSLRHNPGRSRASQASSDLTVFESQASEEQAAIDAPTVTNGAPVGGGESPFKATQP